MQIMMEFELVKDRTKSLLLGHDEYSWYAPTAFERKLEAPSSRYGRFATYKNAIILPETMRHSPTLKETKLVRARIYSKHEHRSSTLMFTLKVLLIPGKEGSYDIVDHLTRHGYKIYENDKLFTLNSKNENLNVSLTNICYPPKMCTMPCNGHPVAEKWFNDDLLREEELIETEFCFVFQGLNKKDLSDFFFKGAINISHGSSNVSTLEISFFIEKEIEKTGEALPFVMPTVTQEGDSQSEGGGNSMLSLKSDSTE